MIKDVAPLAGARIEIAVLPLQTGYTYVAPLAGARIEIVIQIIKEASHRSLPSRERGLKYHT